MKRFGSLIIILLVVTTSLSPPVSATPVDAGECIGSTASVETDHARVDAVIRQAPNRSDVVQINYKRLSSDDQLEVQLPADIKVVRATGFTNDTSTATVRYTGEGRAILEYKIGASPTQRAKTQYSNGSNWLFAPAPTHIGVGVDVEVQPNGVVGNEFLYLGNYTEYSTTVGCHEISLVDSAAGDLPEDPSKLLRALHHTAANLDIGHKYEETTIFATPGFARSNNAGFARTSDAWVTKSYFKDMSYTRVVLHEYIHTRQAYNRGSIGGMAWLIEGSADYLSFKLAREVEGVTVGEYNSWLRNGSRMNAVLSDRTTWESEYVPYGRGGAYMAILDRKIEKTSNRSIEDVLWRINGVGGDESNVLVQRSLFLNTIENTSSEPVRQWANTSLDSSTSFNASIATVGERTNPVARALQGLGDQFEERMTKKPYVGFLVAISMGMALMALLYEITKNEKQGQQEEDG